MSKLRLSRFFGAKLTKPSVGTLKAADKMLQTEHEYLTFLRNTPNPYTHVKHPCSPEPYDLPNFLVRSAFPLCPAKDPVSSSRKAQPCVMVFHVCVWVRRYHCANLNPNPNPKP